MKVLLTGVAGTGKSTLTKALAARGLTAIDLHDVPELCFWQDKKTKERVEYVPTTSREWFDTVDRLCDIHRLKELLNQQDDIIVAGTAGESQKDYLPLFDKVILLQCSSRAVIHRMQTRTNKSGYGKTKAEQDDNIEWQKGFDHDLLAHGAIPLNTEGSIDETVDKIVEITRAG
ncbi:MAG: AAA family ATPase [Patescibacteria group bacterium]